MMPIFNLVVGSFLLAIGTMIADYLWHAHKVRSARRRRLEQRITELSRLRERPTLNTRGRAP